MKSPNNDQQLPIRYENINVSEGTNKLSNLILFYPYNPYKKRDSYMSWLQDGNLPFCGIIEEILQKRLYIVFRLA